ncbi:Uncharacterized protein ACMD2_00003 [Ananas comosus]|uniref:Uncharacterized protein n=1 Tax=Ananas comosus TaxID=4615 RepID=A0A199VPS2_ANACO|nr:Uncharacterized protein ACMD2_00003 [Ananas comosus]
MGNSIGGKRRTAKVMKIDGTSFRVKPPVRAGDVVREHPGYDVLESEEVKQLGVRARPLDADAPLKPGRLYFLVALPRLPLPPDRAWSGALRLGARERLEGLMLARRSSSDLSLLNSHAHAQADADGARTLRLRLPKAEVARLMHESADAADAARKIMDLCVARNHHPSPTTPDSATPTPLRTPDRGALSPLRTPDRGAPSPLRTPDRGTPTGRKEVTIDFRSALTDSFQLERKRTRFADLPDEKMPDYSTELLAYAMQV